VEEHGYSLDMGVSVRPVNEVVREHSPILSAFSCNWKLFHNLLSVFSLGAYDL